MASTYSTNLALELIGTGDQAGTWGGTTNTNLGTLIEQAISGYVTQAITDGADTVITIPNGASGVARNMYIECTGALTAARNLIVPANKKLYFIYNNTTGGYAVTVKVSGQTGVSVPNGKKVVLVSNGTDVVDATNYLSSLSLGSQLTVANGGTGVNTLTTAYGVLCAGTTATGAVQTLNSLGTSGQVLTSNGAAALPSFQAIPSVSGASLVFIQSQTASNSATLDFTTGITSTYDEYLFIMTAVVPATNTTALAAQISQDGGSTWKTDANYVYWMNGSASTGQDRLYMHVGALSNTAADGGCNGEFRIFTPSASTYKKQATWLSSAYRSSNTTLYGSYGSGQYRTDNNAWNGVRFLMDSGNITSGTIALYGVKKS